MPQSASLSVDFSSDADLIRFFKASHDARYRRSVRYPQWYLGPPEEVQIDCGGMDLSSF